MRPVGATSTVPAAGTAPISPAIAVPCAENSGFVAGCTRRGSRQVASAAASYSTGRCSFRARRGGCTTSAVIGRSRPARRRPGRRDASAGDRRRKGAEPGREEVDHQIARRSPARGWGGGRRRRRRRAPRASLRPFERRLRPAPGVALEGRRRLRHDADLEQVPEREVVRIVTVPATVLDPCPRVLSCHRARSSQISPLKAIPPAPPASAPAARPPGSA